MGAVQEARSERVAALRPEYQSELAEGIDRFFEPRRARCPWCGGGRLRRRLRTPDLIQHKPGRFVLDRCRECGHIFQNPRLNAEGLAFYYRDLYDGLGAERMASRFETNMEILHSRAELLVTHDRPTRWLDVGTGHGHFCREAASLLPETEFHGLDTSEGAELAEAQGWVTRGYRANFVDLAGELSGAYDAVSMFHYLEHTLDPKAELAAAAAVLQPGGHLVIEQPDPESRWGRVLGKYWLPWLQPQHLNLVPIANLRAAAEQVGFTVVEEQRGEPHWPIDATSAVILWADARFGCTDLPWRPSPPSVLRRRWHSVGMLVAMPLLATAKQIDRRSASYARTHGFSNAYRLLLRRV